MTREYELFGMHTGFPSKPPASVRTRKFWRVFSILSALSIVIGGLVIASVIYAAKAG